MIFRNKKFGLCFQKQAVKITAIKLSIFCLILSGSNLVQALPLIAVEPVISDLSSPVAIANAGDGSDRLFIVLQEGQIVIYDGAQIRPEPFLDIESLVSCCGERGLLSVAFHPDYISNGFFYINYTNNDGDTVIARYTVSSDPNIADPNSGVILLTVQQPFSNHNGGQLQFGPDGYLYIGMGDGGSGGDPQNNAQNLGILLGKMLRIDVDSGFPYAIPPDNPFVEDTDARGEIWARGLRNPWRFSFDHLMGNMFIADVGQNDWEEVNFQPANSTGGENYGWRLMEGNHCFIPPDSCNNGTLTLPILEYDHSQGCSITGGYCYRGDHIPQLYGTYLYGDFCTGMIWGATRDNTGNWTTTELLDTDFSINTFGEDEAGNIYFADYSANGTIYRIVSAGTGFPQIKITKNVEDINGGTVQTGDKLKYTVVLKNVGDADQPNNPESEFQDNLNLKKLKLIRAKASSGQIQVVPSENLVLWNGEIPALDRVKIKIIARIKDGVSGRVCNKGFAYYDADLSGDNETVIQSDDPRTSENVDNTCITIGQSDAIKQ